MVELASETAGQFAIELASETAGQFAVELASETACQFVVELASETAGQFAVELASETAGQFVVELTAETAGQFAETSELEGSGADYSTVEQHWKQHKPKHKVFGNILNTTFLPLLNNRAQLQNALDFYLYSAIQSSLSTPPSLIKNHYSCFD